ncbi:hypothetical protein V8G57_08975 [Collimonas sp. H4R21]|uniref:Uncharacterized protein n=1 Tax=Collimonas rhizosphaerae TaxID=3126357 RepID=A0ABU9PU52_9BURK
MSNFELLGQWEITEAWLREASSWIVVNSDSAKNGLNNFKEYLSHNELELALDELAEVAMNFPQSHRFWDSMCQAAASMKLDERSNAFATQWAATRGV